MSPVRRSIQSDMAAQRRRGRKQIYNSPAWRVCRILVLTRGGHTCELCGEHATIADHHPVPLQQLLDQGHDPYDPDACRALCARCSGREDGGRT
jgi:5-methylcytosine-specific restriction endonuclease McrA